MSGEQRGDGNPLRPGDVGYYEVLKNQLRRGLVTYDEMLSLLRLHGFLLRHPPPPAHLDDALHQRLTKQAHEARIIALLRQSELEDRRQDPDDC